MRNDLTIYDRVAATWWSDEVRWVRTLRNLVPARMAWFDRHLDWSGRRVLDLGGVIEAGVEIGGIETSGGRVTAVTAGGRRYEGSAFVIAGGSWSAGLLAKVGLKLPLQAGKGYSLTMPGPPELPELCSIFTEAKVAVTPLAGSLRFAGTMEVGGLDLSINRARVHGIVKSVSSYFPKFSERDFDGIEPWAGLRPVSPDGVPYLGRLSRLPNLVVAGGQALPDTLAGFKRVAETAPEASMVVWLNEYFGGVERDGKRFEDLALAREFAAKLAGAVLVRERNRNTFGDDVRMMLERFLTFDAAIRSGEFGLVSKQRLAIVRRDLFEQLDALALGLEEVRA